MKDIEIHNYSKMKKDLKRFSFDVDVNMYFDDLVRQAVILEDFQLSLFIEKNKLMKF